MEYYQLRYFKMVAECQSITAAARKLDISQPSLSRAIRNLEDEMGAELFDRVGRSIVLNDTGKVALEQARAAIDSFNSIKDEVDKYRHAKQHTVDLFAPIPLGDDVKLLGTFMDLHPDIELRVSSFAENNPQDKTPDLMFFASPVRHTEPNFLLLGRERIVLAASADSPYAQMKSVRLADLSHERFIKVLPSSYTALTDSMYLEAGFKPHVITRHSTFYQVMSFVNEGFGVTLAPEITWFGGPYRNVVPVPLSDVHRQRYLYLHWQENAALSHGACVMRDFLADHFAKICSTD